MCEVFSSENRIVSNEIHTWTEPLSYTLSSLSKIVIKRSLLLKKIRVVN